MSWRDSNLVRSEFALIYTNITLSKNFCCIFSKALRGWRTIFPFRFDDFLCISSKIGFSVTGLWSEWRKEANWLTSSWIFCSETELTKKRKKKRKLKKGFWFWIFDVLYLLAFWTMMIHISIQNMNIYQINIFYIFIKFVLYFPTIRCNY